MRTIVQLSDLHFGAILEPTPSAVVQLVTALSPDLVVVSGDLTQRARTSEYLAARAFLDRLPSPQLVVPGNHDIPLYDVVRRFASPLGRYRRHITHDLAPLYSDDEVVVVGINTARSLTFKGGAISQQQLDAAVAIFSAAPASSARILVTHHPFNIPPHLSGVNVVRNAKRAIHALARYNVDLFISGHIHLVHATSAAEYLPGYNATIIQAGSATSTRARGEPNSLFVYRVEPTHIRCETYVWQSAAREFRMTRVERYERVSGV